MSEAQDLVFKYGQDILSSVGMHTERTFIQHGRITTYQHSVMVANKACQIALKFNLKVDYRSLVRGALLHDYFLYDWHIYAPDHKFHGFSHALCALRNASKDFNLNPIEKDIIRKHMFPLNIALPKYKESWIVCAADKWSASSEVVYNLLLRLRGTKRKTL